MRQLPSPPSVDSRRPLLFLSLKILPEIVPMLRRKVTVWPSTIVPLLEIPPALLIAPSSFHTAPTSSELVRGTTLICVEAPDPRRKLETVKERVATFHDCELLVSVPPVVIWVLERAINVS